MQRVQDFPKPRGRLLDLASRSQFHCSEGTRAIRLCGARSVVTVGYYLDGAESSSVLSGSVVALGRVSMLKSFNNVRNSYTRGVNRKSGFAFLAENWKVHNRKSSVGCFYVKTIKVIKNAKVVFHTMEKMGGN
jgi:hypothetical protein